MKLPHLLTILLLIISLEVKTEVTLDGTLGQRANLPGPNYLIGADLGRQHGGNLFHSFQNFNLSRFESATFSGPNSVSNIISRVTGGNPSNIDGLISSVIPNADMYFLNPYGFMFGPNARLDVQGSFHISTADYLRLGNGGRFDARYPSESLLTIAPIEAFGFITDSPTSITTQDSDLSVSDGNSLSLIGGNLRLNGNSPVMFDEQGFMAVFARSKLSAPAGRINLASVASQGSVIPREFGLDLNAKGGTITANNTLVEVSGRSSGNVFIRGGQFVMDDAVIQANTMADLNGKNIDMELTKAVKISGDLPAISNNAFGKGNAGYITITTPFLEISESLIHASTRGEGSAGNITLKTGKINLFKGAIIASDSYGSGSGGQLEITATSLLLISDQRLFLDREKAELSTGIGSGSFSNGNSGYITINAKQLILSGGVITSNTHQTGNAGKIVINAELINMINGGLISATAFSQASGTSGNIEINIADTLHLSGFRSGLTKTTTDVFHNLQSGIAAITFGNGSAGNISISAKDIMIENYGSIGTATVGSGAAGQMIIEVDNLSLKTGGLITTSSGGIIGGRTYLGTGASGTLKVVASGDIIISGRSDFTSSGLFSNTLVSGEGGNIEVQANHLSLTDSATISANSLGTGNAGNITVQANTIHVNNNGNITTSAKHATGGNINLVIPNLLFLREGQIITSVQGGSGNGGNITIENPVFVVLNQGQIRAQANEGHGGDIYIKSEQFIASQNSSVSASSKLGIDGEIKIESPDVDISGAWLILPAKFVDASGQLKPPCSARVAPNKNTLVVKRFVGGPSKPSDLQANMLILVQPEDEKIPPPKTGGKKDARQSVLKVAFVDRCRPVSSPATSSVIPEQLF